MNRFSLLPLLFSSVALTAGCQGAIVGQFAVLAVSTGILMGTLSLGTKAPARADVTATDPGV